MLDYKWVGNGQKVVLMLHGWGGNKNSLDCLSNNYDEYSYLFVEFPKLSNRLDGRAYSIFCYANDVYTLLNHLNITNISIISHSFGGRVAILLASVFDIHVEKLVLIASAGLKSKFNLKTYIKKKQYQLCKYFVRCGVLPCFVLERFGSSDYQKLELLDRYCFVRIIGSDLRSYLQVIRCPTILIWGTEDHETPFYFTKIFLKYIRDCGLVYYDHCGHFVYLERVKEIKKVLSYFIGGD